MIKNVWDHTKLARYANELSLNFKVFSPIPGDVFELGVQIEITKSPWITRKKDTESIYHQKTNDSYGCIPVLKSKISIDKEQMRHIESELDNIAKNIIMSSQGAAMISVREHMGEHLTSSRFVIQLISDNNSYQWFLNLTTAKFEDEEFDEQAIHKYPFGLRMYIQDFIGLMTGNIQIWELATVSAKQWYISSRYESPLAFLYEYFSEQVRPELAEIGYFKSLEQSFA